MARKKRRNKDWHHRVPDFKLVYYGTKKRIKDESKDSPKKRVETIAKNAT